MVSALLYDVILQLSTNLFVFIAVLVALNFLTKGYVLNYLMVKTSRGKKIMMRIFSPTGRYYKPGLIDGETIKFKYRSGKKGTLTNVSERNIYYEMDLPCLDLNEKKGAIIDQVDFKAVQGCDPERTDQIITKAIEKPALIDRKEQVILILCVLIIVGIGLCLFFLNDIKTLIEGLNVVAQV